MYTSSSSPLTRDAGSDNILRRTQNVNTTAVVEMIRMTSASLTGISVSDPAFASKAADAGYDLYACPYDSADFAACVATKTTKGVLGSKYSQVRDARMRVEQAILKKENLLESIDLENKRQNEMLEIENKYLSSYKDTLKNYIKNITIVSLKFLIFPVTNF